MRIGAEDIAHERVFSVADNGIGFAPEEALRLFDMFTRLRRGPAEAARPLHQG